MVRSSSNAGHANLNTPNLYWNAISAQSLRAAANYRALPESHLIAITDVEHYRYLRQTPELRDVTHLGILTTANLKDALGFCEPEAAKFLGNSAHASHKPLLDAYHHLLQPHRTLQQGTATDAAEATSHNEQMITQYNVQDSHSNDASSEHHQHSQAQQEHHCRKAAAGGPLQVALQWGQVQEAAALQLLTTFLPASLLYETGLHTVSQQMLPAGYTLVMSSSGDHALPLMGASPDGIIRHSIQLTPADLAALQPHLLGMQRAGTADATQASHPCWAVYHALLALVPVSCGVQGPHSCQAQQQEQEQQQEELPQLAALLQQWVALMASLAPSTHQPAVQLQLQPQTDKPLVQQQDSSLGVIITEVVEVKHTCPFDARAVRSGAKGRCKLQYVLSDRGPRQQIAAHWVPQLQLHMLATGCHSLLLMSRSATRGSKVFRMMRDQDYICAMLSTLSSMYSSFVLRRKIPPANMYCKDGRYRALLGATARLGRQAVVVMEVAGEDGDDDGEEQEGGGSCADSFLE